MKQILLLERVLDQTRLAVIEDSMLCEIYIQRPDSANLTGNIYLGRVENILPGMNAAFVDIGLDKKGFLGANDIPASFQGQTGAVGNARIEKLVRPGQLLPIQVVRSQPGAKGPRLSRHITLPGRNMVLLCEGPFVGVSKKIEDEGERKRLYQAGQELIHNACVGLIIRTSAQGADESQLRSEFEHLTSLYAGLVKQSAFSGAPKLLYDDSDLMLLAVRDRLTEDVETLWVDDETIYKQVLDCATAYAPFLKDKVKLHQSSVPLFDLYRVDAQVDRALQKQVWLNSGGFLVIEETEALTVIDVNTGKNTGKRDAQDTILAVNQEAAQEILRQLRLRDIGGIIIVDFIDMRSQADKLLLLEMMQKGAALDRNHTTVVDMTALGLVELTRKRTRQSLSRQLTHSCIQCDGNGMVPSHEAIARRALRDLWRRRRGGDTSTVKLEAEPAVCGWIQQLCAPKALSLELSTNTGLRAGEYRFTPVQTDH